ncbi:hypothetical protein C1645_747433 [Glomus cerebriforme]|uniref:Uncharacterized protein n=1 Tax=Glomus cerebriforme TaxID=658196 RepID=A0A397TM62_9GLOM|nr:hypothetical protein C1645_747433 [Glomus cerebriforme]
MLLITRRKSQEYTVYIYIFYIKESLSKTFKHDFAIPIFIKKNYPNLNYILDSSDTYM